jgi:hypothetical protein
MMAALSAKRFVCSATSSMTFKMSPIASMRLPRFEITETASLEVSLMRLISRVIDWIDSAPRSASIATSSERRAVSFAFDCTWSMDTSIWFIDDEVSSAVRLKASTFRATSLIE